MPKRLRGFFCMVRMMGSASLLLLASLVAAGAPPPERHASLRYLGHSCFLLTTPSGARLAIDPFESGEWPGLNLPYVEADWVLVTHPHWDHDAWRAVRGHPKLIDGPGEVRKRDFAVRGLEGRHADLGAEAIQNRNTIFVIETDGLRICHVGDNGPITPALREAIGTVDLLMLPVDSEHRVLTDEQAREWAAALAPRLVIPMHYRVPAVSLEGTANLGTMDEWASLQKSFTRLPTDSFTLDPSALPPPGAGEALAFTLPGERPTPRSPAAAGGREALEARRKGEIAAAEGDLATALEQFARAAEINPADADVLQKIGFLHMGTRRPDRAVEFFTRAVKAAGTADPRTASLGWLGAGMALDLLGRRQEALAAYGSVVRLGVNDENQVDQARRYLDSPYRED